MTHLQIRSYTLPLRAYVFPIGGGGWITGLDIADDGAMVCRTDTYGWYYRRSYSASWEQQLTTSKMGANGGMDGNGALFAESDAGCYEVCIAHSNSQIIFAQWDNFLFKSTNGGSSYSKLTLPEYALQPNGGHRHYGPRMAIHPSDPTKLIVTTPDDGAFYSTDGGANFSALSGVSNPTSSGPGFCVAFDPATPTTVYVASYGRGVYRSTTGVDGSFSLTTSGPTTVKRLAVGSDGVVFATDVSDISNLWRFQSGSWTNLSKAAFSSASYWHSVCPDPANAGHWYFGGDTGNIMSYTADNGGSFVDFNNQGTRVAATIPWLAATNEAYMTNGDMRFDPSQSNVMFFAFGIGTTWCSPPTTSTSFNWNDDSAGIEQLVSSKFVSPPGGDLIYSCWDRCVFTISDLGTYPSGHGPDYDASIRHGWSAAYATQNPGTIIVNTSGDDLAISSDGGVNWTRKAAPAGTPNGGSVAASTSTNWVWVGIASDARMKYTTDGGDNWSNATMTGIPTTGETGWGVALFLHRFIVCADHVTANVFYAYNNGANGDDSFAGIWKSTDSGANWTQVYSGRLPITGNGSAADYSPGAYNAVLESIPNNAGHLLFTGGNVGGSITGKMFRSQDAGVTWEAFPNVLEAKSVGCGKGNGVGAYPTVHFAGWYNNVYGVWVSENANAATIGNVTWTRVDGTSDGFPLGRFDEITHVCGDNNTYGRTYVGYRGSGPVYIRWA